MASILKADTVQTQSGSSTFNLGASGDTIKIASGSPGADKVLTSDASGNATWGTAGGGSLEFISRNIVNSVVSDISINSGISTTYDNYRLIVNNLCVDTAGEDIKWGFRTTTTGTVAEGAWVVQGGDTTNQNPYYYGASGNLTMARYITHDGGVNASIDIYNPFISTVRTQYTGLQGSYNTNRSGFLFAFFGGVCDGTQSEPHIKIWASSGDIGDASIVGYIDLYGYKKS